MHVDHGLLSLFLALLDLADIENEFTVGVDLPQRLRTNKIIILIIEIAGFDVVIGCTVDFRVRGVALSDHLIRFNIR